MPLQGFTDSETMAMAAAYYSTRSADVDWDKAYRLMGSKSIAAAKERCRVPKKKVVVIPGDNQSSAAPAGGIDKSSPSKVKQAPKKAAGRTRMQPKSKVKVEENEAAESQGEKDGSADQMDEDEESA